MSAVRKRGRPWLVSNADAWRRTLAAIERNPPTGAAKVIHDALARELA